VMFCLSSDLNQWIQLTLNFWSHESKSVLPPFVSLLFITRMKNWLNTPVYWVNLFNLHSKYLNA
jgi:hypothetical protein